MSEGEQKLVDTSGDYRYVVKDGQRLTDSDWRSCRFVLTSERMVLATSGGKQAIPHSRILVPNDEDGIVPDDIDTTTATPLQIGDNVILVDAQGVDDFESEYCRAALHDEVILVKHRAVVGGVIQEEASWSKCQFRLDDDVVSVGLPGGKSLTFDIENVGTIDTEDQQVMGEERTVVKVEHTDEEDHSVETHFSGMAWHSRALESLLQTVIEERGDDDYELSDMESQVLMALYSGVSPFQISEFVGMDVEQVEEIFDQLIEQEILEEQRVRREVQLKARGRHIASEAMDEE